MKKLFLFSTAAALALVVAPVGLSAADEAETPPPPPAGEVPPPPEGVPLPPGERGPGKGPGEMKKRSFPREQQAVEEALRKFRETQSEEDKAALKTAITQLVDAETKARIEQAEKQLEQAKKSAEKKDERVDRMFERLIRTPERPRGGPGMRNFMRNMWTPEEGEELRELRAALRDKELSREEKLEKVEAMKALYLRALERRTAEAAKAEGEKKVELERGNGFLQRMIDRMNDPEKFLDEMNRPPVRREGDRGPRGGAAGGPRGRR